MPGRGGPNSCSEPTAVSWISCWIICSVSVSSLWSSVIALMSIGGEAAVGEELAEGSAFVGESDLEEVWVSVEVPAGEFGLCPAAGFPGEHGPSLDGPGFALRWILPLGGHPQLAG